jgi:hypothetical protein
MKKIGTREAEVGISITVFTPKERERPVGRAQRSYILSLLSWFRKVKHSLPTHLR